MRYFDTFTGIGGFSLAIHEVISNATCIGFSEIDKYASAIYQKHYPNHKNYGDITKIIAEELPDFDLLVGGFPCQAFSIAGKRRGFEDTRGTMFFELARILRAKQPRLFIFENVKGLQSHDQGNTFKTIISTIDELGYDVEWQVLNSKNHGVPQNRERVFIVGHLRGTPRPEVFPFRSDCEQAPECGINTGTLTSRYPASQREGTCIEENGNRGGKIEQINQPKHSNNRVFDPNGLSPTLNTMQGGNRQPFVMVKEATKKGYAEASLGDSINLSVPNSTTRRGRVGKQVAQTLDTGMQQHTLTKDRMIRKLTPTECERLQGFPDGWTKEGLFIGPFRTTGSGISQNFDIKPISDSQRYKCLGNAVTVNVVQDIIKKIIK